MYAYMAMYIVDLSYILYFSGLSLCMHLLRCCLVATTVERDLCLGIKIVQLVTYAI